MASWAIAGWYEMGYEKYTSKAFEGFEKLWKKFLNIFAFGVLHDKILVCF